MKMIETYSNLDDKWKNYLKEGSRNFLSLKEVRSDSLGIYRYEES